MTLFGRRVTSGLARLVTLAAAFVVALVTAVVPAAAAPRLTPTAAAVSHAASDPHRVVAYYQTQYDNGDYVSPLPLQGIATDIEVAAIHLDSDGSVHVNDTPPDDPSLQQMWTDLATLRNSGMQVIAMLGGAGVGSYANLASNFSTFYPILRDFLQTYDFNGIDLDIEEPFSLADTEQLINQLRSDFGSSFIITMSPVATDLSGSSTFSGGFSYPTLEQQDGGNIAWYNAQFYCGWGDLSSTADYEAVINNGFSPDKVVAGTVTNSANCSGYVDPSQLTTTIGQLNAEYPNQFGGVAGWEYFNAVGPQPNDPAGWYAEVAQAMS